MSEAKKDNYKIRINKDLLTDFFRGPAEGITDAQIREVKKTIAIILTKYYSKYSYLYEDLRQDAFLAIMRRRDKFDSKYSAYTYIYTVFRNEIGNKILSYTKETDVEDMVAFAERMVDTSKAELPLEVAKYLEILTGEKQVKLLRMPKKDVVPLIFFIRNFESRHNCSVPSFVQENGNAVQLLYRMIKDFIE